jgi:DNA-binding beta-propeller fold protein YncE
MRNIRSLQFVLTLVSLIVVLPSALGQVTVATVPAGTSPFAVAVNPVTNKTYVANISCSSLPCPSAGTVTVIDGATNNTATVPVGVFPQAIAIDPVTNQIYVANKCGNDLNCGGNLGTVTVIDGVTNNSIAVTVGVKPDALAVNSVTNEIYVANYCGNDLSCQSAGTVTVIDGATNKTTSVNSGNFPTDVEVNSSINRIYVINKCGDDHTCLGAGTATVIDGATNNTTTVNVGLSPNLAAVNVISNEIYVANTSCTNAPCPISGTVTVIDGATNNTTTVNVGVFPYSLAINALTNKIYVANKCGNDLTCTSLGTVTVIDGATNNTVTITVGAAPYALAVNSVSNEVYVANYCGNDVTCKSAGTVSATNPVAVGDGPQSLAINATTNRIYVPNNLDGTVSVIAGDTGLQFVPVTPCRVVDTRQANGPFGGPSLQGGTYRSFPLPQGSCNIPPVAAAFSLNVTLVPSQGGPVGYLTTWPAGEILRPGVSTMNSLDGRIKANAAVVPAGLGGAVNVYVSNTADVVLDIDGYFVPTSGSTLAFYPLTPCRVLDTRNANGDLGGPFLSGGQERDFPLLESTCIPPGVTPQAYSMNFTVVPYNGEPLGYLTVWPTGESQPLVSTLNNPTATIVANAAIVSAGTGGKIATYPTQNTQLVGDINGYFAPAGQGGLSLYPAVLCRALDTRQGNGAFNGELTVNAVNSVCAPPATSQAYVFNATVVPVGRLGYLTLWPDGEIQPVVSTLNAIDGAVTSNMAVVPTTNGKIDAYASGITQLILDISSYFAP